MRDEQSRSRLVIGLAPVAKSPLDDFASKCFRRLCAWRFFELARTHFDLTSLEELLGFVCIGLGCRAACRVHL